jgi:hypothetical protein
MKPKTIIVIILLGFVAVSVGYLIVKEVRPGGKVAPTAAGALPKPAIAAGTTNPAPAGGIAVAPTAATAGGAETTAPPEADDKVVTVFWFYDNKH